MFDKIVIATSLDAANELARLTEMRCRVEARAYGSQVHQMITERIAALQTQEAALMAAEEAEDAATAAAVDAWLRG